MANGINPQVKPASAKPKKSNSPAILGGLCVLLLGSTGYFYSQVTASKSVVNELQGGLVAISKAAESDAYTLEKAAIATNQAQLLTALTEAVGNKIVDVNIARTEAAREKEAAAKSASELDAAVTQLADARRQLDAARKESETAKNNLNALQKKFDSEVSVLNAKIEALEGGAVVEADQAGAPAVAAEATPESAAPAASGSEATPDAAATAADGSMVIPEGGSQLFKTVRYEAGSSKLTFVTLNDQKLVYSDVPAAIYAGLSSAPVFDIFYRFKIMETFPSSPKDVDLIPSITAAE